MTTPATDLVADSDRCFHCKSSDSLALVRHRYASAAIDNRNICFHDYTAIFEFSLQSICMRSLNRTACSSHITSCINKFVNKSSTDTLQFYDRFSGKRNIYRNALMAHRKFQYSKMKR